MRQSNSVTKVFDTSYSFGFLVVGSYKCTAICVIYDLCMKKLLKNHVINFNNAVEFFGIK